MLSNYGSTTSSQRALFEPPRPGCPPIPRSGCPSSPTPGTPSSCANTPRRQLVMPSLRSLVTGSSGSSGNNNPSRTNSSPRPSVVLSTMGASTSSAHIEQISTLTPDHQESCSRLIAPRPSLIPALSPKRPMKRDASCGSLLMGLRPSLGRGGNSSSTAAMRKCETVMALSSMEPLRPINRLRVSSSRGLVCSRCSSLLSMHASASRISLNTVLETNISSMSTKQQQQQQLLCKLCLCEVPLSATSTIQNCQCSYCTECLRQYVSLEVAEAAYEISCPDAHCDKQGVLSLSDIETLVSPDLVDKHRKFRLDREVDMDSERIWCPRPGCETVCRVCPGCLPQAVHCPTCDDNFCSICKQCWHPGQICQEDRGANKLVFDPERIKRCPMCGVPIEKDEGCAQMMCKRCKHVFCWYCLASLDDDFLLRHYDKGPCKNKLGHSRASVIWHRTQVIAIFAGFGVLLLVASPLLLLAAPCIVCCKCRSCQDKPEDEEASNTNLEQTPNTS